MSDGGARRSNVRTEQKEEGNPQKSQGLTALLDALNEGRRVNERHISSRVDPDVDLEELRRSKRKRVRDLQKKRQRETETGLGRVLVLLVSPLEDGRRKGLLETEHGEEGKGEGLHLQVGSGGC